jgi:uncharacterized protein YjbI with pentapeptide repeats
MKKIILASLCLIAAQLIAQTKIKATDIIKQINEGTAVNYSNAEIEGDLDLTDLQNRSELRSANNHLFHDDNTSFESVVEVPVNFTGCTFLGNVLAYYHIEQRNETYVAHFEKDAVFKNCVFKEASEFKYTEFNGVAEFISCTFNAEANFKYAEFSSGPLFTNAKFERGADFKYTEFPRETSFEKAIFHGQANFKYSKFKSPLKMDDVAFRGSEDFKYTKIDGRDFTSYLLQK